MVQNNTRLSVLVENPSACCRAVIGANSYSPGVIGANSYITYYMHNQ